MSWGASISSLAVTALLVLSACVFPKDEPALRFEARRPSAQSSPAATCGEAGFRTIWQNTLVPRCSTCHGSGALLPAFADASVEAAYGVARSRADQIAQNAADPAHGDGRCCGLDANSPELQAIRAWSANPERCPSADESIPLSNSPAELTHDDLARKLRGVAFNFCDRAPATEHVVAILEAPDAASARRAYEGAVESYLTPTCLKMPMLRLHQNLLGVGDAVFDRIANGGAWLGSYVVVNDLAYSDLITANYCIGLAEDNRTYVRRELIAECQSRATSAVAPGDVRPMSGVLTNQYILKRYQSAYHFRQLRFVFENLLDSSFPFDGEPRPLAAQFIPRGPNFNPAKQPTHFHPQSPDEPNCVSCHQQMNLYVRPFWEYYSDGRQYTFPFALDPNMKRLTDLQAVNLENRFEYYGTPVRYLRDLGLAIMEKTPERFDRASAKHFLNYAWNRGLFDAVPEAVLAHQTRKFSEKDRKVRPFLLEFLRSDAFLEQPRRRLDP
ncbi:MAG: hypothetical protein AB7F66_13620 [Bacteriovoracia bacterium]